jgi:hypothetical protein
MTERLRILIHGPIHPSWYYVCDKFPKYDWTISYPPSLDPCTVPFPEELSKFNVLTDEEVLKEDYDVQIIVQHLAEEKMDDILAKFNYPIVWVTYWHVHTFAIDKKYYPLIYTCKTSYPVNYPGKKYFTYFMPTKHFWKKDWIGDKKVVFIPSQQYSHSFYTTDILHVLQKNKIPIICPDTNRQTSFEEWKDLFVHSRVFLETHPKNSSTALTEAMNIGMPVIVRKINDMGEIIRNGVDGFSFDGEMELPKLIQPFLEDQNFARSFGEKAKTRINQVSSIINEINVFNQAFQDALILGKQKGKITNII